MANGDKSTNKGNFILVLVAMILGVLIGVMFASHGNRQSNDNALQGKVSEVLGLVEKEYVDTVDVDSLNESLLAAMLSKLDPHSTYLSARETERTEELIRGNFEGIGIVLHYESDSVYVGQVLAEGPSAHIGLLPGDLILAVDGDSVSGIKMPTDSVISRLRGPRGTKVEVMVRRHGSDNNYHDINFTIRRGIVNHSTVLYSSMLDDTTGYILLSTFASTSHNEFHDALSRLKQQGMQRLIFDLRDNGGGSLTSAIGIAGELLPAGSLIVYTKGAHSRRRDVRAHAGGLFTRGNVIVMVDEGSASASEVVSGALQDNDRALIVGRRTFGKGLVQSEFELNDGSSVMLTTARYYTPSGRCIQRPYDNGTDKYYQDYFDQLLDEAYADTMTIHIADSTPYHTVGGRTVYGGGGIVPDLPLPYRKDTSFVYFNALSNKGLINRTAFRQVRLHASELLQRYPTAKEFVRGYHVGAGTIEELVKAGEAANIVRNSKSLSTQRRLIECLLKAHIGMALYGNEAFYDTYLPMDEDLNRIKHVRIDI